MKIVVIGGGIAGLSIAWRLRQHGADVTVLERAQPGMGATWASAGMIAATAEGAGETSPQAEFGRASAKMWPAFAAEIEEASGRKIGFVKPGSLIVARTQEDAAALQRRAASTETAQYLTAEQARAREPMLAGNIAGALFDTDEAVIDNRAVGLALARAFVRAGGTLQSNEALVRFEVRDDRIVGAVTPFSFHHADIYVLAAGAWSSQPGGLPESAVPPVIPVKGEMIALQPPEGTALPGHIIWGDVYIVPRLRRLFVGATVMKRGFDTTPTQEAEDWLYARAVELLPDLRAWDVSEHWAGLRPGTPDDRPLLGVSTIPNLFVASGQFRNGILFAPAIAESMSALVRGEAPAIDISAFDPKRFVETG